jgi:D-serine deaminase-like pyridoxal phosphate-dependent protein
VSGPASYPRLKQAVAGLPLPLALVDLAAFDHNLERLLSPARREKKLVRLATKSLRVVALIERALARGAPTLSGLMVYSVEEAQRLVARGFLDLLLGYPAVQPHQAEVLAELAAGPAQVVAMVDDPEQLLGLSAAAVRRGTRIKVAIDLDVSYRPFGGLHVGVRRSPVHGESVALSLARRIAATPGLQLHGLMGYEAQLAGLPDHAPGRGVMGPILRALKIGSRPDVLARRGAVRRAIEAELGPLAIVNGAGTGSIDWSAQDPSLTEVTIGSGLLAPHLFDHYAGLSLVPALAFALPITRRPGPGLVTCQGGGYVASGAAGPDRLPQPWLPEGLALLPHEGTGEVQTPLQVPAGVELGLGDPVFFRPAKAGELAERFLEYQLIEATGARSAVPTYRGEGWSFG